jgi:maltose O-acetyltransferase
MKQKDMEKTDWEKMQDGEIYNDFERDLFNRRVEAKKLFRQYNRSDDSEVDKRRDIMRQLFGAVGENVWIEPDFRCEFGKNITIGNDVYINFGCVILDCGRVTIGDQVLIGPNVGMYDANHALDATERMDGALVPGNISIGNRVWIGGGVIILPNVSIGDDSVIGAGSVVTRDIPRGVVAVGNPCRVLRAITPADKVGFVPRKE